MARGGGGSTTQFWWGGGPPVAGDGETVCDREESSGGELRVRGKHMGELLSIQESLGLPQVSHSVVLQRIHTPGEKGARVASLPR
jgi:hypothetical protein